MTVWVCVTAGVPTDTLAMRGLRPPADRSRPVVPVARLGRHDEVAVAVAVELAAACGEEAAAVTVGDASSEAALRSSLALGCKRAVRVEFEPAVLDAPTAAARLADAIYAAGPWTMIVTGVRGSPWETGQVPGLLACRLDVPYVGGVSAIEPTDGSGFISHWHSGRAVVERLVEAGGVISVTRCLRNRPEVPSIHATAAAFAGNISVVPPGEPYAYEASVPALIGSRVDDGVRAQIRFGPDEIQPAAAATAERLLRYYIGR